ncbi:MAG: hemolysin III family protein, partial [Myxococcota bacterium]
VVAVPLWVSWGGPTLRAALPTGAWLWLGAGGLAYTVGVVFFSWEKLPYHHTAWHGFVLVGAACHFAAILGHVVPVG